MTKKQKTNLIRIIVSAVLVIGVWVSPLTGWLEGVLYLIPYFIVGYDILLKAVKGIFRGQVFDENFLMAVATVGAMALGDWREGCAVMVFYQIGELFQSYAVGKSRRSISDLMDIRPDYANIESGGALEKVDPEDVAVGAVIVGHGSSNETAVKNGIAVAAATVRAHVPEVIAERVASAPAPVSAAVGAEEKGEAAASDAR